MLEVKLQNFKLFINDFFKFVNDSIAFHVIKQWNISTKYYVFNNVFNPHLRICSKVFSCLLLLQPKHAQLPC